MVNNDHFLYWGEVTKPSEDGIDFQFQTIEQTEFIDDASFQPFKGMMIIINFILVTIICPPEYLNLKLCYFLVRVW